MANANVAVVQQMYQCFTRGDMDTLRRQIFAPNLEWTLPGRHPLAGVKRGAEEVIAFFGQLVKSGIKVDLVEIDAIDDEKVVEIHRGHGEANGVHLDALNCTHYTVRDGKIVKVQVFIGDQHPVDHFFWKACRLKPVPDRLAEATDNSGTPDKKGR